jgi:2-deoxy-D-gluconate 3-dehydrogenase
MNIRKPVQDLTLAEWHQVLDTNLTSAFLASRAAYPIMKRGGGGKIINIGSMMSLFGTSFAPAYAASKGGIVQLTRAMASGWARDNIQVNAVLPGWIDTERSTRSPRPRARAHARRPLGRGRRSLRNRSFPRRARVRFRHRYRDPGGRGLFDPGLGAVH